MIQNSRGVYYLPTQIFVVGMSNIQRFCGESIGLYLHIGSSNLIYEARFSNIWKSTNDNCPGIWINGRQTTQMLSNLFQICQTLSLSFHNCSHSTQGSTF